jgi:hypothetical protein
MEITMKTYDVLYAADIPHYATKEIEAENDEHALQQARLLHEQHQRGEAEFNFTDPAWNSPVSCRILHIEDPDGRTITQDIPLDGFRLFNKDQLEHLAAVLHSAYLEIRAWRDGLNVRNKNNAKIGSRYADEKLIIDAISQVRT